MNNAPLLDNVDIIKTKTAMLDNLLEIEIAYSLLKTGIANNRYQHYVNFKLGMYL